jgi:hypothetical protein
MNWMYCSSDGIAVIDLDKIPTYNRLPNPETQVLRPWADTALFYTLGGLAGRCVLSSVEINTSVAASSLERSVQLATIDVKVCRVGDESFRRLVPEKHVGQLLHQIMVLKINHVLYVSASETGITFIVLAY